MEDPKQKRAREGTEAMSQYEADARAVREKTARLRELRLKHEAANQPAPAAPKTGKSTAGKRAAGKSAAVKKKPGKSAKKGGDLSEWLTAQQKEGRRG